MKSIKILTVTALAFLSAQCSKDTIDENNSQTTENPTEINAQTLQKLEALGFDIETTKPEKTEDGYAVEGDIEIHEDHINEFNFEKQSYLRLVSCARSRDIKVRNNLNNKLQTRALTAAMDRWNNIGGSNLRFRFVTRGHNLTVRQDGGQLPSGVYARAVFPAGGRPGNILRVNTDVLAAGNALNLAQLTNLFTHELGHIIGLIHTDDANEVGANLVPGTGNDGRSIMASSPGVVISRRGLSNGDRRAVSRLYNATNNNVCN